MTIGRELERRELERRELEERDEMDEEINVDLVDDIKEELDGDEVITAEIYLLNI